MTRNVIPPLLGGVTVLPGLFLVVGGKELGMFLDGMLFCQIGVALNFWLNAQDYPRLAQPA